MAPDVGGPSGNEEEIEIIPYSAARIASERYGEPGALIDQFSSPKAFQREVGRLSHVSDAIKNMLSDPRLHPRAHAEGYIMRALKKKDGPEFDFAIAAIPYLSPLLREDNESDSQEKAIAVIGMRSPDSTMWWTLAPYLYRNMVEKGLTQEAAFQRLIAWAKTSPEARGEHKKEGRIGLAGLEMFDDEGIHDYGLPRDVNNILHKFTAQEAERIVTSVFGIDRTVSQKVELEHTERPLDKPAFALDAWKYTHTSALNLIAKIASTDEAKARLQTTLERDGGKAFGLEVCKLIAARFARKRYSEDDIVSTLKSLPWKMIEDIKQIDASRDEGKILRSSTPLEDWLDPRSGVKRSFVLTYFGDKGPFEYMQKRDQLPDSKYLMQDAIKGFGTVLDIGYSSVHGKVLAKMTYGNVRTAGYNLTSATYDTEAGVGVWDAETGEPVLPTRNFFHPSMLPYGKKIPSDFFKDLYATIRESGIDFGVQLEIIIERGQRGYLVQVRPTPEATYRRISTPQSTVVREGTGTLIAESATVNGAFDFTGEAHLFGQDGIVENSERVKTGEKDAHGKVGIYDEASASGGRKRYLRLDEISSPEIYLGGYLGGAEVQITREAIRPNSHHGVLSGPSEKGAKMYDELDKHCGMVSITRTQMERLTEAVKKAGTTAQLRVVSDGLVARIYLLEK